MMQSARRASGRVWRSGGAFLLTDLPLHSNLATIDMNCTNPEGCSATVVSYYNQQLRSADEGQTTF